MHFRRPFSPEMCGRWTKPEKQISVFKQKRTDACGRGLRIEKCLLIQLVRIAVVKGSYPGKPEFFRLSFHNCINCLFLCVDLLYIIFFIPRFKCTKFINSSFFLTQLLTVHSLFQMKANSHEIKFQRVISRFRNRKGNWSSFVNLLHNRWVVHSPLLFRKMVEIKRVPLREAIPPSPTSIKPRLLTHTSVHLKPKWPPVMLSARSRRSYGKIGVYAGTV